MCNKHPLNYRAIALQLEASETNSLTTSEENLLLLALPLSISGLMLIVPMVFGLLSRLEKYHEERHRFVIRKSSSLIRVQIPLKIGQHLCPVKAVLRNKCYNLIILSS